MLLIECLIVLLVQGKLVDAAEFIGAGPDVCPDSHYHAANGSFVTALDGTVIFDPNPGSCGYGTAFEVPNGKVFDTGLATDTDFDGLPDIDENALGLDPTKPDSDGDGILDGDEDSDGDLLSNNRELYEFQTDPTSNDTDGDMVPDGFDIALEWQKIEYTAVPAFVGAFRNAGASVDDLRWAAQKSNQVLKYQNVRLVPIWFGVDVDAGDDGDGILLPMERLLSKTYFNQMIDTWGGLGIYAGFLRDDWAPDLGNPRAASAFGNPTFFMKTASHELMGAELAHEFGHDMGMRHPMPGSADDVAHNVMQTFEGGLESYVNTNGVSGLFYPDLQLAKTRAIKLNRVYGRTLWFQDGMATLLPYQFGRVTDDYGDSLDGGGTIFDLNLFAVQGIEDEPELRLFTTLHAPLTDGIRLRVSYGFDADDDGFTGVTFGTKQGVDIGMDLELRYSLSEGLRSYGFVRDFRTFTDNTVSPRPFALSLDVNFGIAQPPAPVGTGVLFTLPKALLALAADEVPVYVKTQDDQLQLQDEAELRFRQSAYLDDPTLSVTPPASLLPAATIEGGDSVSFQVAGLTPSTGFELLLDETLVLSDTTDGSGGFAGAFTVPGGTVDGNHFLTALDATGQFGFTVFTVPEPGASGLTLAALAGAAALARVRRGCRPTVPARRRS